MYRELDDNGLAKLTNDLVVVARKYATTQQLRARLSTVLRRYLRKGQR